jgi:hypothetical protein
MKETDVGPNCSLTLYLKEVSRLEGDNLKAQFAGALLFELGYPHFTQWLPDATITTQLFQELVKASETNLLFEAAKKCVNCPESSSCKVGELFNFNLRLPR